MMPSSALRQPGPTSINQYQDVAVNVVYNFCSIFTIPIEMLLRPQYGTRYFPPIIMFLTATLMVLLPLFSSVAQSISHMLPFARFRGPIGLYGIGTISKLYFTGSMIHGFRTWRRMVHMEREEISAFEGPALPIFRILPRGFWKCRIIYEPVFVLLVAIVLSNVFVLQSSAQHYLMFAALMLAMKNYCAWYMAWQYLRELMDMKNAGPILAKIVDNTASDDEFAQVHLASLPPDPDIRRRTVEHVRRILDRGYGE